jgi:hypothetical protein
MDTDTKLADAENDLKRLMDDVSRAMHKAQEAVGRITAGEVTPTARDWVETSPLPS